MGYNELRPCRAIDQLFFSQDQINDINLILVVKQSPFRAGNKEFDMVDSSSIYGLISVSTLFLDRLNSLCFIHLFNY